MGRVCYRFIDSPYRMEFFVDENRTAYSGNDRIRAALDQYGVDYSRIIYTYDEYRNILYGNGAGPEMSRYSLMESKQYQNIPRTIQNVLLNSKLDAEFIKKTIISSINEDETAIDLNTYKEHLKNFETRLRDIEEFQKRETQKQAKEITSLSAQVSRQQTALVQGCRELAATYRLTESQLPKAEEQKHQAEKARTALLARRQELQEQSRQRCDKMQEALAILNNELQKAQQKEYARRQIEEIMERSARKEEWKNKQQGLQEEQRILTSHYTEISTKYKSLIQSLDEQWNRIHEAKIKQLEGLNNTFNARIEEARYRSALPGIRTALAATASGTQQQAERTDRPRLPNAAVPQGDFLRSRAGGAETPHPVVHGSAHEQEEPHQQRPAHHQGTHAEVGRRVAEGTEGKGRSTDAIAGRTLAAPPAYGRTGDLPEKQQEHSARLAQGTQEGMGRKHR